MKTKGKLEKKNKNVEVNDKNLTKSLIILLIGFILILMPDTLNKIVGILVGLFFLILGLIGIYKYVEQKTDSMELVTGILYAVLGAIIMLYPHSIIRLVAICLGVYLLISGLIKVKMGISFKDVNTRWVGTLIVGILIIVLGLLLIFNPFSGIAITKLAGFYLILLGAFDLIDNFILQK